MKSQCMLAAVAMWVMCAAASAHVTVWPRESHAGAYEKYVVRVPTEGNVATRSVELAIPENVTIVSIGAPAGFTYELKRAGKRVIAIVWSMPINPGEFAEFAFMARNPAQASSLSWTAVQRFADGSSTEWKGPSGDKHPAPVTSVLAATESAHSH